MFTNQNDNLDNRLAEIIHLKDLIIHQIVLKIKEFRETQTNGRRTFELTELPKTVQACARGFFTLHNPTITKACAARTTGGSSAIFYNLMNKLTNCSMLWKEFVQASFTARKEVKSAMMTIDSKATDF